MRPDSAGPPDFDVEDGIVGVKLQGNLINNPLETVQIQGHDLLVRLKVSYAGGVLKIALALPQAVGG